MRPKDKTVSKYPLKFEIQVENGSLSLYSVTSVAGVSWERFGPGKDS